MKKIISLLIALRPAQWLKNLAVFAAIIFTGQFLEPSFFWRAFKVFVIFCLLSSSSYLFNDIVDAPYDRQHPLKRNRPIARGELSVSLAATISLVFLFLGLFFSLLLGWGVFFISLLFIILHFFYSLIMKRFAVWDIIGISFSFILRTLAGEVATGFHLPIWLMFTVIFLSLFIASGKRRSELITEGSKTRPALAKYQKALLNFYTSIFAVATLISYSLFTYFIDLGDAGGRLMKALGGEAHWLVGRKWLMITILPVIFGIMRYAQLVFDRQEGERPERMLASDIPLALAVLMWGLMVILIIYVI